MDEYMGEFINSPKATQSYSVVEPQPTHLIMIWLLWWFSITIQVCSCTLRGSYSHGPCCTRFHQRYYSAGRESYSSIDEDCNFHIANPRVYPWEWEMHPRVRIHCCAGLSGSTVSPKDGTSSSFQTKAKESCIIYNFSSPILKEFPSMSF